jgi:hypothetical protein
MQEVVQPYDVPMTPVKLPRHCHTGHPQNMTYVSFYWCSRHTVHEWQTVGFSSTERSMRNMQDFISGVQHINDVLAGSSPVLRLLIVLYLKLPYFNKGGNRDSSVGIATRYGLEGPRIESLSRHIPIRRSVRQGCPLSMMLYALCLNPLLQHLTQVLKGLRISKNKTKTVAVA